MVDDVCQPWRGVVIRSTRDGSKHGFTTAGKEFQKLGLKDCGPIGFWLPIAGFGLSLVFGEAFWTAREDMRVGSIVRRLAYELVQELWIQCMFLLEGSLKPRYKRQFCISLPPWCSFRPSFDDSIPKCESQTRTALPWTKKFVYWSVSLMEISTHTMFVLYAACVSLLRNREDGKR